MTTASHHEACGICHTDVCEHTMDELSAAFAKTKESPTVDQIATILASVAYDAIMKDLLGRCGIENAFDDIDADIRAEIDATCVKKATAAIEKRLRGDR